MFNLFHLDLFIQFYAQKYIYIWDLNLESTY